MLKAYKYRIYPNKEQEELFAKHFGCVRFVFNWALGKKQTYYNETSKNLNKRQIQNELVALKKTKEYNWLTEVNSQSLLAALENLDIAYKNFFRGNAKLPKFKKKYNGHQSFHCPQHVTVDFKNNIINLPKIKLVECNFHRLFEGIIKTCTISKTPTDKYYVSILVEDNKEIKPPKEIIEDKIIGIDLGINHFLVTSNGTKEVNNKYLQKNQKKMKKLQRRLAKKAKSSSNRAKMKKKLAKLHEKITNQRKEAAHQISAKLVYKSQDNNYALEDLSIRNMVKNHKLARAINDCGWYYFTKALEYKARWVGKNVIYIDRWEPSSKKCSCCGNINKELKLHNRIYRCSNCEMQIDRDMNAAINIKHAAIEKIGKEQPQYKPADYALSGIISNNNLDIHRLKQEAFTISSQV